MVATTPNAAAMAQPRRDAGLEGSRPSSSRAIRATSSERRSARPATGTPRGEAWIHSATVARHFASETAEPVFRMAHSSLRYSAVVSSSRRASRLSGWKKRQRSIRLAPASQRESRRARWASSCASMLRCCSAPSSDSASSGTQISERPRATGLEMVRAIVRRTRRRYPVARWRSASVAASGPSLTARRSARRPTRISRRAT